MSDPYWFQKKWGLKSDPPIETLLKRIEELEERVLKLEDENTCTTNELYRLENSLDARIDILAEHCRTNTDV